MKNFSKDYTLLKSLIQAEFLFTYDNLNSKFLMKSYVVGDKSLNVLDPVTHVKSIKQFIRILQTLKNESSPVLQFVFKNPHFDVLIYDFLKQNAKDLYFIETWLDSDIKRNTKLSKTLVLFDCFLNSNSNVFFNSEKFVFNLLFKINGSVESFCFNNYKIYNNVDSVKNLIFFLIIIKQTLKK